jgi:hypothetical protein
MVMRKVRRHARSRLNLGRYLIRSLAVVAGIFCVSLMTTGSASAAVYCSPSLPLTGGHAACSPGPFSFTVSNPLDVQQTVYLTPVGNGTAIPDFGDGQPYVAAFLESYFGPVPPRQGGACGSGAAVDNFCSGGGTSSGHSSLSGNFFAVHIGGQDGVFLAVLYSHVVSGFDISFTASPPSITGVSSIWAYNTAVTPIPAAVWLFGSGLGLLGWVSRKSKRSVSP